MSGLRRVIVGASGSPGNLCALRYAEHLARATGAALIPVHAWIPPGGDLADRRCPSLYLRRVWTEDARQRLAASLQAAWGQLPADLTIDPVVARGEPGPVLTAIAYQPGDILVIGTGRRGRWPTCSPAGSAATAWPTPTSHWWPSRHPHWPSISDIARCAGCSGTGHSHPTTSSTITGKRPP